MTDPAREANAPPRPELDLLKSYVEALFRAWDGEEQHLSAIAEEGPRARQLHLNLVIEYFFRALGYGDGIWHVLNAQIGIAYFPLMRSLYEAHAALRFVATLSEADQLREAQLAAVHSWYHARWRVRNGRRNDPDGSELARIEAGIARVAAEVPQPLMAEAERREGTYSWTGKKVQELVALSGLDGEYEKTYGSLSSMTHGHYLLIAKSVVDWTPQHYENAAANCRAHLQAVRRLSQDILHLRFSDPAIDSFTPGDYLELRYPHAWIKVNRP